MWGPREAQTVRYRTKSRNSGKLGGGVFQRIMTTRIFLVENLNGVKGKIAAVHDAPTSRRSNIKNTCEEWTLWRTNPMKNVSRDNRTSWKTCEEQTLWRAKLVENEPREDWASWKTREERTSWWTNILKGKPHGRHSKNEPRGTLKRTSWWWEMSRSLSSPFL